MHALKIDTRALAEPAKQIREEHRLALECRDSAIGHAIEAGRLLLQVKQRLGHGEFVPWVEAWCSFKYPTAHRYMVAAKQISTGVEISSLRALFPSGRAPRTAIPDRKQDASSAPAARAELRSESSTVVGTPSPGPVVDAGNVPHPEWTEDGAPSEEEIVELDQMIAAGEAAESDQEPAGFYFGGIVPKVLPDGERLQQLVTALEQRRNEAMTLAHNRLDLLKRKTSQCDELETQVRHWRSRAQDLEATERENAQLRQRIAKLEAENEALRERVAVMEVG